jgi:hypothetical protein
MFYKVVAAYNESPEAERALISAIKLTKIMNGELQAITVMADLPAYTAFAGVADPSLPHALKQDRETKAMERKPSSTSYASKKRTSWSSDYISAISTSRGYGALFMNWHRKHPAVFSGSIDREDLHC